MKLEVTTKYDINDKVIVKEFGSSDNTAETTVYNTGKKDEDGDTIFETVPIVYTIYGIQVDLGTGKILYNIRYNNENYIFPAGGRTCKEEDIIRKVE